MNLFDRRYELTVGTRLITGLRVVFNVEKSLSESANHAEVQVTNLAERTRADLADAGTVAVSLKAGYAGALEEILNQELQYAESDRNGASWVTTLQTQDGITEKRQGRASLSISSGTTYAEALAQLAEQMSNVSTSTAVHTLRGGSFATASSTTLKRGLAVAGNPWREFVRLARAVGIDTSIQDGELVLLRDADFLPDAAVLLSPSSGLVGSPKRFESKKGGELVKAPALLQPPLTHPGRRVQLKSQGFDGVFRIERVTIDGDTHGEDWHANLELKAL